MWITDGDSHAPATSILIDIGPDFRSQALKSSINRLDALLVTHGHADHLNGLDDIRIFSHTGSKSPSDSSGQVKVYPEWIATIYEKDHSDCCSVHCSILYKVITWYSFRRTHPRPGSEFLDPASSELPICELH
jgi:ribonuclease BN (tRNA processing enzyme)